jgi:hypothetical protein
VNVFFERQQQEEAKDANGRQQRIGSEWYEISFQHG